MADIVPSSSDEVFNTCDGAHNIELQIKIILDHHKQVNEDLKVIQNLGAPITEEGKMSIDEKLESKVLVALVYMKKVLIEIARKFQTARQMAVLELDKETPVADPSVQFFGVEWILLFKRWKKIGHKIATYGEILKYKKVDLVLLGTILQLLNQTMVELQHHQIAVVSGNLTQQQLDITLKDQRRVTTIGEHAKKDKLVLSEAEISEKLRRKSFNINPLGVSIQQSLRRRPSHFPKHELSPVVEKKLSRRKSNQEAFIANQMEPISQLAASPCGVRLSMMEK